MYIIFQVDGGIGKCIAATAVVEAIAKKYPSHKIIVVSGYPEVWMNNPHVHRTYQQNNISYFYDEYINGKDSIVMLHNPYMETDVVYEKKHLIAAWCNMLNVPYKGEQPKIYLTNREIDYFQKVYLTSDKPLMIMQTNGGAFNQPLKYSWARDIPYDTAKAVVEKFKDQYNIIHIRREDQPGFEFTTAITGAGFREIYSLLALSEKRFLMDSFVQHACAALNLPATVCWIANSPVVFGYDLHDNIQANPFTTNPDLRNAYITKFNISGEPMEFPYNSEKEIFNLDKIIESLSKGGPETKLKSVPPADKRPAPRKVVKK